MTITELHKKYLQNVPPLDGDLVLSAAIQKPREFIHTHPEYRLSFFERLRFFYALHQLQKGVPVAYITHRKEFFGLDFYVDKRVLVPRPDTEVLVEAVLNKINSTVAPITLIDIGTGSGCVPIAILKTAKQKNITAVASDISRCALQVARKNARTHNVSMHFFHGYLLKPILNNSLLPTSSSELVITANLPYGWKEWKNNSSVESRSLKYEPAIALFTNEHGLKLYRELLEQLATLNQPFTAFFEFDPRQTQELTMLITKHLPAAKVEIKEDLAGRDRVVRLDVPKKLC